MECASHTHRFPPNIPGIGHRGSVNTEKFSPLLSVFWVCTWPQPHKIKNGGGKGKKIKVTLASISQNEQEMQSFERWERFSSPELSKQTLFFPLQSLHTHTVFPRSRPEEKGGGKEPFFGPFVPYPSKKKPEIVADSSPPLLSFFVVVKLRRLRCHRFP